MIYIMLIARHMIIDIYSLSIAAMIKSCGHNVTFNQYKLMYAVSVSAKWTFMISIVFDIWELSFTPDFAFRRYNWLCVRIYVSAMFPAFAQRPINYFNYLKIMLKSDLTIFFFIWNSFFFLFKCHHVYHVWLAKYVW